jgi:hypothetical protein
MPTMTTNNVTVIVATNGDLPFVDHVQRKFSEQLAFIPRAGIEKAIAAGQIALAFIDGEPVGYVWRGALGVRTIIVQAAIEFDAQRRHYGAALVAHVIVEATRAHSSAIVCRCGSDLEANSFWQSLGFVCVGSLLGGGRRGRVLNVWHYAIARDLFGHVPVEPFAGKITPTLNTGLSPFARPRRKIIINPERN